MIADEEIERLADEWGQVVFSEDWENGTTLNYEMSGSFGFIAGFKKAQSPGAGQIVFPTEDEEAEFIIKAIAGMRDENLARLVVVSMKAMRVWLQDKVKGGGV